MYAYVTYIPLRAGGLRGPDSWLIWGFDSDEGARIKALRCAIAGLAFNLSSLPPTQPAPSC